MKLLASVKVRIFLTCWILFTVFFATNVVREHYPAFAFIDRGDWVCDRYYEMHADLFLHTDGHVYTGNNVIGSVFAIPPLLLFDPLLDALEEHSKRKLAENPEPDVTYDTKYPNRRAMFAKVKQAGLDLRFGASTAITSAFLMAPLSALTVVLMYHLLIVRGVRRKRAIWLAMLFAFATPVFYRTAHLNHNVFLMQALFLAFVLLWVRPEMNDPVSLRRRVGAGFLCGIAFALDYAGAIPVLVLTGYLVITRLRSASWSTSLKESIPFVIAGLPGLFFLLGTQWAMYGDPFTPGQFVMNEVNYTDKGVKGIGLPTVEVFFKNLFSPSWGLFPFAPLLLLGFLPMFRVRREEELVFPRHERRWAAILVFAFLMFCAANWYSLMQFNTGFRYLLPVVPFLFLFASDHLVRMRRRWLTALSIPVLAHSVVLCMMREVNDTEKDLRDLAEHLGVAQSAMPGYWSQVLTETAVPYSWTRLFTEGVQLPWLTVLRQTSPRTAILANPLLPLGILAFTALVVWGIWSVGSRRERFEREVLPATAS